jgi:TatD DNase family protein
MKLFDAHCHLVDSEAFERAVAAGVEGIAVCGTNSNDWEKVLELSEKFPTIGERRRDLRRRHSLGVAFSMIGIHPWFVRGRDGSPLSAGALAKAESRPDNAARPAVEPYLGDFQTLERLLRDFPMSGIGECGLDFQDRFQNRAEQEECFAAHLQLATELNRPVAIHCVQAWGRMLDLLREFPEPKKILHAFGGAAELIPELAELNCWFSFCGNVTHPKAKRVRAAVAAVPAEGLLIETDSPDFPPAGCESPNEPANLIHVARAVAALRGVPVEEIAERTFHNATSLFNRKSK